MKKVVVIVLMGLLVTFTSGFRPYDKPEQNPRDEQGVEVTVTVDGLIPYSASDCQLKITCSGTQDEFIHYFSGPTYPQTFTSTFFAEWTGSITATVTYKDNDCLYRGSTGVRGTFEYRDEIYLTVDSYSVVVCW